MRIECQIGDYTLSVEKITDDVWYWTLSYQGRKVQNNGTYGNHAKTASEAKRLVKCAYLSYKYDEEFTWKEVKNN